MIFRVDSESGLRITKFQISKNRLASQNFARKNAKASVVKQAKKHAKQLRRHLPSSGHCMGNTWKDPARVILLRDYIILGVLTAVFRVQ